MGYYNMPVHEHPLKERVRAKANHYVTGREGGRDIDQTSERSFGLWAFAPTIAGSKFRSSTGRDILVINGESRLYRAFIFSVYLGNIPGVPGVSPG
jgi:hypothetical protein